MKKLLPTPSLVLAVLAVLCVLFPTAPLAAQAKPGPPSPEMQKLIESATKKYQEGDLKGAITLLEPLRARANAHPAALSLLGFLYLQTGRPKESLGLLGPIADTDAAGPLILSSAARAALAVGENQRAEKYLRAAMVKSPGSLAGRDLGLLLGNEGRVAESYELLRPWALAHADDGDARLAAAFGAVELGRGDEAEELLNGLPRDNPRVQLLAARTRLLKDDPPGAIALLEPLAASGPPELLPEVRRNLARTYLGTGASAKAVALLQGKVGDDATLAVLLGRAQYKAGNPAEAVTALAPFAKTALAARTPPCPATAPRWPSSCSNTGSHWWRPRNGPMRSRRSTARRGSTRTASRPGNSSDGHSSPPASAKPPRSRWPRYVSWRRRGRRRGAKAES